MSFLEAATDIRVQTVGSDVIQLQFLDGSEDLNLILNLTLKEDGTGNSALTDVKVRGMDTSAGEKTL